MCRIRQHSGRNASLFQLNMSNIKLISVYCLCYLFYSPLSSPSVFPLYSSTSWLYHSPCWHLCCNSVSGFVSASLSLFFSQPPLATHCLSPTSKWIVTKQPLQAEWPTGEESGEVRQKWTLPKQREAHFSEDCEEGKKTLQNPSSLFFTHTHAHTITAERPCLVSCLPARWTRTIKRSFR